MPLVAGIDLGGGAVKACVADVESGRVLATARRATPRVYPGPGRDEFESETWWRIAASTMRDAVDQLEWTDQRWTAVTVTSLRQGYVLLDDVGELGRGVLNSDRRGDPQLERLRAGCDGGELYRLTGHWPAPQLTLPKLLQEAAERPARWSRVETVLFVHDWALWRMSGVRASEPTMASSGQLLDVHRRSWAEGLISDLQLPIGIFPPLHDPGSRIGELRDDTLGLPLGVPVVTGGADTQVTASGVGGLTGGVITVVAGTTTPVQASSEAVVIDAQRHPWVSAHLAVDRWALETNAGYAGMSFDWLASISGVTAEHLAAEAASSPPGARGVTAVVAADVWSEAAWSSRTPSALVGFEPRHHRADLARSFLEAHGYAIRSNIEDLERVMGAPAERVCLTGGASRSIAFCQLMADVTGRPISRATVDYPQGRTYAWLAARGERPDAAPPAFDGELIEPGERGPYDEGYDRFIRASEGMRRELAGWTA